jgi:2'-5' RNA ligase
MTNRLFVAAHIPDDLKEQIISIRTSIYKGSENIKWERKEKFHFTLKFLGDVEESRNEEIANALSGALGNQKKIRCEFDKFGFFYKNRVPKILWLGLKHNEKLMMLAEKVDNCLSDIGFSREKRKFKPHLTILRIRGNENFSELMKFKDVNLSELTFFCDSVSLIKSVLKPESSVYYSIIKFKFI